MRSQWNGDGSGAAKWYPPRVPLQIAPHPGTVLICDYDLARLSALPAEMTKRRPVVVLSPRRRREFGPLIVVPLTTSPSDAPDKRHVRIPAGRYGFLRPGVDSWVKCEFICSVSSRRLYRLRRGAADHIPQLSDSDLRSIMHATLQALGAAELLFGR